MTLKFRINNLIKRMSSDYDKNFRHTGLKLKKIAMITVVGIVGFPAYFFVWEYLFKQPYENLWLRLVGSVLCGIFWLMLLYNGKHSLRIHRLLPTYCYMLIIFCLPFFFTFMALKNGFNAVWMASAVCSVLYLILLLDIRNMALVFVVGTALGALAFAVTTENATISKDDLAYVPVLLYAFAGAIIYKYNEEAIDNHNEARQRTLIAVGSSIAHEMRTPLLGIALDAQTGQINLPPLVDAYAWATASGWKDKRGSDACEEMDDILKNILQHAAFANAMIDILLMNIGENKIDDRNFACHTMAGIVAQALNTYPFDSGERRQVIWQPDGRDFAFVGSDLLMRHVLYNLLKNALRAIAEARLKPSPTDGPRTVTIRLESGETANHLLVRDTGTGIAADKLAEIFKPFYTGRADGTRVGIGLAFSWRVIDSFGGRIACRSELGHFTEFDITLPPADPPAS